MVTPPEVDLRPGILLGHIVQIALSKDQLGKETRLIPPLRVVKYVLSVDHNSPSAASDVPPMIYFLGLPLPEFLTMKEFASLFGYVAKDSLFMFHSNYEELQPHFCLDQGFLGYLERERESVPIDVYMAGQSNGSFSDEMASDRANYTYMDFGLMQLFVPSRGFVSPWPSRYPLRDELTRIQESLLSSIRTS